MSVRSASETVGVTVNTLLRRVRAAGIPYRARVKRLFPPEQQQILRALARGESVADICRCRCVSASSTYRILASSADAQRERRQALLAQSGKAYRSTWRCLVRANPHASRSTLRQLEPAVWAWLSRRDRIWLEEQEPPPLRSGGPRAKSQPSNEETAEAIARLRSARFDSTEARPLTMQKALDVAGIPSAAHTRLLRREVYKNELASLLIASNQ
ncbi:TnsD family Tn7-like transposition protein [Cupriavidus necator]